MFHIIPVDFVVQVELPPHRHTATLRQFNPSYSSINSVPCANNQHIYNTMTYIRMQILRNTMWPRLQYMYRRATPCLWSLCKMVANRPEAPSTNTRATKQPHHTAVLLITIIVKTFEVAQLRCPRNQTQSRSLSQFIVKASSNTSLLQQGNYLQIENMVFSVIALKTNNGANVLIPTRTTGKNASLMYHDRSSPLRVVTNINSGGCAACSLTIIHLRVGQRV